MFYLEVFQHRYEYYLAQLGIVYGALFDPSDDGADHSNSSNPKVTTCVRKWKKPLTVNCLLSIF
jgi:hypothetical protein